MENLLDRDASHLLSHFVIFTSYSLIVECEGNKEPCLQVEQRAQLDGRAAYCGGDFLCDLVRFRLGHMNGIQNYLSNTEDMQNSYQRSRKMHNMSTMYNTLWWIRWYQYSSEKNCNYCSYDTKKRQQPTAGHFRQPFANGSLLLFWIWHVMAWALESYTESEILWKWWVI